MIAGYCLLLCCLTPGAEPTKELSQDEQTKLMQEEARLDQLSLQQFQDGKFDDAIVTLQRIHEILKKLYPESKYPGGHEKLILNLNNTALVLQETSQLEKALEMRQECTKMARAVFPPEKYPDGNETLATLINNMGMLLDSLGAYEQALPKMEEALAMRRKLARNDTSTRALAAIANSENNVGAVLDALGINDKALHHYEEALALRRKIYPIKTHPNGHPELLATLSNLAGLLLKIGSYDEARKYVDETVASSKKLYPADKFPKGHPTITAHLLNAGFVYGQLDQQEKATEFYEQMLAMERDLWPKATYPIGHPNLALAMTNLGMTYHRKGKIDVAERHVRESLAMMRELFPADRFPDGNEQMLKTILNLGTIEASRREFGKAASLYKEGLAKLRGQILRRIAAASEADALAFAAAQPTLRDLYLDAAIKAKTDPTEIYGPIWDSKAIVTRVLEQRLASTRADAAKQTEALRAIRAANRQIEQVLQTGEIPRVERDRLLAELTERRDKLERHLAEAVPLLQQWKARNRLGAADLAAALPAHSAFVDVIGFVTEKPVEDANKRIKIEMVGQFVAFIVPAGGPIRIVDLGPGGEINRVIAEWRRSIDEQRHTSAAAEVSKLIWSPIAAQIPAGTRTLYLSLDRDTARAPWCALPGSQPESVLLDEFSGGIATVPHGPFLLEALRFPSNSSNGDSVLAIGALDYFPASKKTPEWPALTAAEVELKTLKAAAGSRPVLTLTAGAATGNRLQQELRKAAFVHFATHGFFANAELETEKKREEANLRNRRSGQGAPETRLTASKNPLGFNGLVMSRGEIFTGLSVVDLSLEHLRLVTLSACETGLGEYTGGEGVFGLTRAFHLAGCPNVVASLWKVNDAATAALMAKFYHELWINKRPPIEALREAQLTVYRRPDLIPDLSGERGAPNLKKAVEVKSVDPIPKDANGKKTANTKLWAAFVLSGVGK